MTNNTKFPNITVTLIGEDGNAFAVLGAVKRAMQRGGVSKGDIDAYMAEAMSGDYNHLLATTMQYVEVC